MPLHMIQTNDNKQITVKDVFIQQKPLECVYFYVCQIVFVVKIQHKLCRSPHLSYPYYQAARFEMKIIFMPIDNMRHLRQTITFCYC